MPLLIWVISPAICGSILAAPRIGGDEEGWLPGIADGTQKMAFGLTEPDAGSNSHNVTTTARRDGERLGHLGLQVLHLGHRPGRCAAARRPATPTSRRRTRSALSIFVVPTDAPGLSLPADRHLDRLARQAVHGLPRRRPGRPRSLIGVGRQRPAAGLRRAEPRTDPGRRHHAAASAATRSRKAAEYAKQRARLVQRRSARTRASPTRWPRPTSPSSSAGWPRLAAPSCSTPANPRAEAANIAEVRGVRGRAEGARPGHPDPRRQRARPTSTDCPSCGSSPG